MGVPVRKQGRTVELYPASVRYAGLSPVTHSLLSGTGVHPRYTGE
jgi:hypothetical protein